MVAFKIRVYAKTDRKEPEPGKGAGRTSEVRRGTMFINLKKGWGIYLQNVSRVTDLVIYRGHMNIGGHEQYLRGRRDEVMIDEARSV